jgi:monomeric isocitrate dehydrogenase
MTPMDGATTAKIIYTKVDEAPALATFSLLPIVEAFTAAAVHRRRDARHLAGRPDPRPASPTA